MEMFGDILLFLEANLTWGSNIHQNVAILQDEQKRVIPLLEMAISNLDGDGSLVLECFEKLEAIDSTQAFP